MHQTLSALAQAIGITSYPQEWDALYPSFMEEYAREGAFFLEESFLRETDAALHCLLGKLDVAIEAAKLIRDIPDLCAYAYILYAAMKDRALFDTYRTKIKFPETSEETENRLAYDTVSLFPLLAHLPQGYQSLQNRGVPADIIAATMRNVEECMLVFESRFDRDGFNSYFGWMQHYVVGDILTIGRLQFEMKPSYVGNVKVYERGGEYTIFMHDIMMHKSGHVLGARNMSWSDGAYYAAVTEADGWIEGYPVLPSGLASDEKRRIPKDAWKLVLEQGDPVISVHIPRGSSLTEEACEKAYSDAKEVLATCYPDFTYKAFICFSWLMDRQLQQFMKPTANIARFQSKYMPIPTKSEGMAVFTFLFVKQYASLEALPERTSLERGVKQHYLNGGCIYEPGGIFFL